LSRGIERITAGRTIHVGNGPIAEIYNTVQFRIGNLEKSAFSPSRSPAIFDDEILAHVIIANDQYCMVPRQASRGIGIYPAAIIKKVIINSHRCWEGTVAGKGVLETVNRRGTGGHIAPTPDFIGGSLPVRTGVTAAPISARIVITALQR
jgi:hypothetical protein